MADDPGGLFESEPTRRERILLSFRDDRDRELLREWLSSFPSYTVETSFDPDDLGYDLVVCDRASIDRHGETIAAHVAAVDPVFLPVVVATTDDTTRARLPDIVDELADDVIGLPADKRELERRLANLLKARRASKRLAAREEQYQNLVELTPEGILLLEGREITFANAAAADMLGVDETDTLRGRSFPSFLAAGERPRVEEALTRIEADGSLDDCVTCEFTGADGERAVGSLTGVRVSRGDGQATQLVIRDVTDERRRREQLHLFGRAIDAASQGITIADARAEDEPLIYANEAFDRITGYSVAEVLGRNCRFLQGENTHEETVDRIRTAIDAGEAVAVEVLNYRKDGTPFWNQLEIVPITDEDGVVTHFLGLQKDVTEQKERVEQLDVMSRVLRHNVRNRMNVIEGYAQQIENPEIADRISRASEDLLRISDRVREFRSVTTDGDRALESVELRSSLERVIEGLRSRYPDARLGLTAPDEVVVRSHPLLFSSIGEVIESALDEAPTAEISVVVSRNGSTVTLDLCDHGGHVPTGNLAALERGTEDPLEHPRGIELWLLRWVVFHTKGDFSVQPDADPPVVRMQMPVHEE